MTRRPPFSPAAALRLLRPQQWIKNVFVLAGIFFSGGNPGFEVLRNAGLAFAAFCLASGAVYALNDLKDAAEDRNHPRKRLRPIASGAVSPGAAVAIALVSGLSALGLAALVGPRLLGLIVLYGSINVAYSLRLKHVVLVDVFCIAAGFSLRLLAGTWGVDVPPSQWFILCAFLLSLFLGFSKRYAERIDARPDAGRKRAVVESYSPEFLRVLLSITLACTLIAYGLYTVSPHTLEIHGTGRLVYTLPFAAFAMFRYLYLVMQQGFGEDLSRELARDGGLQLSIASYAVVAALLLF
jgi:4-hydroxybenzoate polyprenyltransferase